MHGAPRRRRLWSTRFAAAVRWLHIYISLLGFTALLFFAVTGITLNHPAWFGGDAPQMTTLEGAVDPAWLHLPGDSPTTEDGEIDHVRQVDRLAVVEHLRSAQGLRGAVSEFRVDEYECLVLFKRPGYAADVYLSRDTFDNTATTTEMGTVALINDLHKGRDTGPIWSWVIDLSAALMTVVSITGIVLIFYIKRRRWSGIITAVVGTILFAAAWLFGVP